MSGIKVGVRRIVAKHFNNSDQNTLLPNTRHLKPQSYEPEPHPDAMLDSPMQSQYFGKDMASPPVHIEEYIP